jgi:hypothetical protein
MWGHDTGAHMFRTVEVARALTEGVLYPRFLPDAYGGLGGPILVFNPAAPYYLPALLILLGIGPIAAFKAAAGSYLVAGGVAMRIMARSHLGRTGAAIAGLAWVYLPYRIGNLYVRMAFSELAVMIALPLAMAATRRATQRPGPKRIAIAALLTGAIPAVHFPGAVLGLPLVVAYVLFFQRRGARLRASLVLAGCVALALTLSSFVWLPAALEIEGTHYLESTGGYDNYQHHFVRAVQLLSPRWGFGASMPGVADTMSFQAGWAHLLALAIVTAFSIRFAGLRATAIFCSGVAAAASLLMLSVSKPLWDLLPVLQNVQFPWRNLMPMGLVTSLAAGLVAILPRVVGPGGGMRGRGASGGSNGARRAEGSEGARRSGEIVAGGLVSPGLSGPGRILRGDGAPPASRLSRVVPMLVIAVVVGSCLPYLEARGDQGSDADFTPAAIRQRYFGELKFQPIEVATPRFRPSGPRATLAGEGQARITGEATHRMTVKLSAAAPTVLRLHLFASPGWRAAIDGVEAPVRAEPATGLLTVEVPAGASEVVLRYGNTPLRLGAWILSGLSLLAVVAMIAAPSMVRRMNGGAED